MLKLSLIAGTALLLATTGAHAQDATMPADPVPVDQSVDPAAPAPTDTAPPADTTMPTDAMSGAAVPADPMATATPPTGMDPAKQQAAAATVQSGWAKYDPDNTGKLTPLEFGAWIMSAGGQDVTAQVEKSRTSKASNLPAVKVLNATAAAFSKADTDRDRMISPEELTAFLAA